MSRGQLARTPDNFPRMKWRAAGRLRRRYRGGTYTGGYRCPEHGIAWNWGKIGADEYEAIQQDIADHEAEHDDDRDYVIGVDFGAPDSTIVFDRATGKVIGPEDWPTETELRDDLTRPKTGRIV